jgi:AraC-like DNA-binding protein
MAAHHQVMFSVHYLDMVESVFQAHGRDIRLMYAQIGLDTIDPLPQGVQLDVGQFMALLDAVLPLLSRHEPASLQLLRHLPLTAHGMVGMACLTADRMGDALAVAIRYSPLLQSVFEMTRSDGSDYACITLHQLYDALPAAFAALLTELYIGSVAKMAQFAHGAGRTHPPRAAIEMQVLFTHDSNPDHRTQYQAYFHGEVRFAAAQNQFLIAHRVLAMPLFTANRLTHQQLIQQLEKQLQEQQAQQANNEGLVVQIRSWLTRQLHSGRCPTPAQLASHFALSERTLTRRLRALDHTPHQLIETAQFARAEWLLGQTALPLQHIAEQIGFADATSFSRAFKRRTQQTPTQWRQGQRSEGQAGG